MRDVHLHIGSRIEANMAHISRDANDGPPGFVEAAQLYALADGIFAGPHAARGGFADEEDLFGCGSVGRRNITATQQGNVHCSEKSRRNAVAFGAGIFLRVRVYFAFDMEAVAIHVSSERNLTGGSG